MRILSLILAVLVFPNLVFAQKQNERAKNILIIYSDDHSYHALGAAGNKEISTPNLDKLAKSGLMFTQRSGRSQRDRTESAWLYHNL